MFIIMHFDYFIHSCNHYPKQDIEHFPHPRMSHGMIYTLFYATAF